MALVILDRDGVINIDSPDYIRSAAEWRPIPGSLDAIARLTHAGHRVAVATNQAGVGRGIFTIEALNAIHEVMLMEIFARGGAIAGVFFCACHPDDGCECRKPKPGLLKQISERLRVPLDGVPMVGDSQRDLDAARAAGARPVLVRTGNGRTTEIGLDAASATDTYDDLDAFVDAFLADEWSPA
ncbi:MAG: D-glycero-beta-D-manno-heptose 1,7-bisphosphate 7-phosphatase [Chromatiales bacterium]|jgi:D-glycero-D-manno-heptose 1,7-bisphosphate phosphatase|nr:D-glycero-beta-D-manno-heptose 1,7-bisphosphate 7-phosphatase [Chromatiales bacterium]